jgi:ABC-type branched-subunit amino acid transport system ATPase component
LIGGLLRIGVKAEEVQNRTEAIRLLGIVGLENRATNEAGELSYGQQKLLTVASCLATGCRILLLDEPVAGIHPEMISIVLSLLSLLSEQGKLVIFIEHDIDAVRRIADHVIAMDEGRIIAQGVTDEVLRSPAILEAYVG